MSYKSFKIRRAARRLLPQVFPNLLAVDKQLKPCYLWDAFKSDLVEIQNYLKELHTTGQTQCSLSAFSMNETIFVTECGNLRNYLNSFSAENVTIVDVSLNKSTPSVLLFPDKLKVLDPVLKSSNIVLSELQNPCDNLDLNMKVDISVCNITTLFGVLLGYPVFYWYRSQSPDSEFKCLSMVPLTVYKVVSSQVDNKQSNEYFSFSIPQEISNKIECVVQNWFDALKTKSRDYEFCNLVLTQRTVTLPSVSM